MTKVTTSIFSTIFSDKTTRFAGSWLTGAATSRSARRRLNAILRLACRTLGLKRGKGLGMLCVAAVLAVGLTSPVLAQTASPVTASSPDMGTPPSLNGEIVLDKGMTLPKDFILNSGFEFTVRKGAVVVSSAEIKYNDGTVVPRNIPLERDYTFSENTIRISDTSFVGPVKIKPGTGSPYPVSFPAGTVFPDGTTFPKGGVPSWVKPGVPTTNEFTTPLTVNTGYYGVLLPTEDKIPAKPDARFTQIKINTNDFSKPATTSTDVSGDIAIGAGAIATGGKGTSDTGVQDTSAPATAIGIGAEAKGVNATALGDYALAKGTSRTEQGMGPTALGGRASATGFMGTASVLVQKQVIVWALHLVRDRPRKLCIQLTRKLS